MSRYGDYRNESGDGKSGQVAVGDRQTALLDDLRVEIARLADAVERQNELLEEQLEGCHE